MRSLFTRYVSGVKSVEEFKVQAANHESDRPVTIPDVMSYSRPLLALKVGKMLLAGERYVTPYATLMALSDMEGFVGRFIDKKLPESRLGTSAHGADLDIYMDAAALVIVGSATMLAPRVSAAGKLAMGTILGVEGVKAGWALMRNSEFVDAVHAHEDALTDLHKNNGNADYVLPKFPHRLQLPSSAMGKDAMANKLVAASCAVATNDTDNVFLRRSLDGAAVYFVTVGAVNGENARRQQYEPIAQQLIAEHKMAATELASATSAL